MRRSSILIGSVALIGAAYLADLWLMEAFREDTRTFQTHLAAAYGGVARLVLVGFVGGLGWMMLRGSRSRLVGAAMVVVGLYLALSPIYPGLLVNTGIPLPPLSGQRSPVDLSGWASAAVVVLGVIMILRPSVAHPAESRPPVGAGAAERASA